MMASRKTDLNIDEVREVKEDLEIDDKTSDQKHQDFSLREDDS